MAITIEDEQAVQTLLELTAATGESPDVSVRRALVERLERVNRKPGKELLDRLQPILAEVALMPVLDARPADDLLGYNESGCFD